MVYVCNGAYMIAIGVQDRERVENIAVISSSIFISMGVIVFYLLSGSRFEEGK